MLSNTKSIVLIEDNKDDIELTIRAFRKSGINNEIHVFQDAEEAWAYFLKDNKKMKFQLKNDPAMVLLDLKLKGMDGFSLLESIKKDSKYWYVPVIILTSSNNCKDLHKAYKLGANSFLTKPVDYRRFIDLAMRAGLYWLFENETLNMLGQ